MPAQQPAQHVATALVAGGDPVAHEHQPGPDCETVDGHGQAALPGLIDCHAHPAFLGDRAAEFELRSGGASYEEIHASGGGILSTVRATRGVDEDGLCNSSRASTEESESWEEDASRRLSG